MMLDTGICKIYQIKNTASPGDMPNEELVFLRDAWYGELSYETTPRFLTALQEDVEISTRIRVLQDRRINRHTVVVINNEQYRVERAYHGRDDESGDLISDLSLSRVVSEYGVG